MRHPPFPESTWDAPSPLGQPQAVENGSSVAAPLLAGFALALSGQILVQPEKLRWPDATLFALAVSVVLLVLAVQLGFEARRWRTTPDELLSWYPDTSDARRADWLRESQRRYAERHRRA